MNDGSPLFNDLGVAFFTSLDSRPGWLAGWLDRLRKARDCTPASAQSALCTLSSLSLAPDHILGRWLMAFGAT